MHPHGRLWDDPPPAGGLGFATAASSSSPPPWAAAPPQPRAAPDDWGVRPPPRSHADELPRRPVAHGAYAEELPRRGAYADGRPRVHGACADEVAPHEFARGPDELARRPGRTDELARHGAGEEVALRPRAAPRATGPAPAPGGGCYLLALHLLGLAGLPRPGWLERAPEYELFLRAGSAAKRVRPRIPAPPPDLREDAPVVRWQELLQQCEDPIRLDERVSLRLPEPAAYLQIELWEERPPLLAGLGRAAERRLVGQSYVPLEAQFNRRPCTWPLTAKDPDAGLLGGAIQRDVGVVVCKFSTATVPSPVRGLHVVEAATTASEVELAWAPPATDGGTPLRGYRVEARAQVRDGLPPGEEGEVRTASAPTGQRPSVRMQGLAGNTAYAFRVWALSEAGPGPATEILGRSAPVAPSACGTARAADPSEAPRPASPGAEGLLHVAWAPPLDSGGAAVVAYRVWLRPLFRDRFGDIFPADGWLGLGIFEHQGGPTETQTAPLAIDALPRCAGCLCSVAALNAAGHTGPSTPPAPVLLRAATPQVTSIHELSASGQSSRVTSPVGTACGGSASGRAADPGPVAANGDVRFPWDPDFAASRPAPRPPRQRAWGDSPPDARPPDGARNAPPAVERRDPARAQAEARQRARATA